MKHGWEHITFYVQKHITPLLICSNPPLFATSRQERPYLWDLSIAEVESKQRLREQTTGSPHSGAVKRCAPQRFHQAMDTSLGLTFSVMHISYDACGKPPVIPLVKDQWCGTLIFLLMSAWASCWTDSQWGGDLIRIESYLTPLKRFTVKSARIQVMTYSLTRVCDTC